MAEYVFNSAACKSGLNGKLRLVMDFVDLDSDKWRQYASYKRFPASRIYEIEQRRLFDYEMRINRFFHHSVFVSHRETQVFQRQFPDAKNIHVIGNGVNYRYFAPADNKALKRPVRGPILIFTGYMNYFANEDGVDWFCRKILPRVRAEFNDVQFYIVGNKPTAKVQRLGGIEGVHVTGYTADIRQYYHKADVCVIPLRIARGLQNKILEAMATGNAVVATSNAADGIICENGKDILIANSEQEFAESVIELLKNERRRSELGTNAVENVRENYNWDLNLKKLEELLINRQGKDA
jgi:sugar transferase (PEP-CTERM/EpsH1 system associated)